jgi:hypothetical protein
MIEEMLKSQGKLAARKQLYWSLAQMFYSHVQNYKVNIQAIQVLPDEMPEDTKKAVIVQAFESMAPLYRTAVALKSYKSAFGEFPEFSKFLELSLTEEARKEGLSAILDKIIQNALEMERNYTKKAGKAHIFARNAFGDAFMEQCNKVRIRGEV